MIVGLGNDICDIRRIEQSITKFGDRFINRIFSEQEIAKANKRKANFKNYAATYAKRFAAKEALMKALGTGYAKGVHFKKISIVNDISGKPTIELSGSTADFLKQKIGDKPANINVTMTDEYPYAFAVVLIEVL